jgi:hypothetical protein
MQCHIALYCAVLWCVILFWICFTVFTALLHHTVCILYHTLPYLNVLSCVILYCCATQYSTVQVPYSDYMLYGNMQCLYYTGYITTEHCEYGVALFCIVLYFFVWHHYVVYRTVPYTDCAIICVILICTVLLCTQLCCTVQYSTVQYSTVQYSTVLFCSVLFCAKWLTVYILVMCFTMLCHINTTVHRLDWAVVNFFWPMTPYFSILLCIIPDDFTNSQGWEGIAHSSNNHPGS